MKKTLPVLLIVILLIGTLSGCGTATPATVGEVQQSPAAASADSETSESPTASGAEEPTDFTGIYDPTLVVTYARNAGLDP